MIQKEWLSFGHRFASRCGNIGINGVNLKEKEEISPVFIQFLDCVHQLLHQYPHVFEFTESMLTTLGHHVYSGRFGTFMGDCEEERKEMHLKARTTSVWYYLKVHQMEYMNRFYLPVPNAKQPDPLIKPNCGVQSLRLWSSFFMQWNRAKLGNIATNLESTTYHADTLNAMYDALSQQNEELQMENDNLQRQLKIAQIEINRLKQKLLVTHPKRIGGIGNLSSSPENNVNNGANQQHKHFFPSSEASTPTPETPTSTFTFKPNASPTTFITTNTSTAAIATTVASTTSSPNSTLDQPLPSDVIISAATTTAAGNEGLIFGICFILFCA